MTCELIPMEDPDVVVLIINSNVQHSLASGEYGTRRTQCQQAAELLSVKSLRFASLDQLEGIIQLKRLYLNISCVWNMFVNEHEREGGEAWGKEKYGDRGQKIDQLFDWGFLQYTERLINSRVSFFNVNFHLYNLNDKLFT